MLTRRLAGSGGGVSACLHRSGGVTASSGQRRWAERRSLSTSPRPGGGAPEPEPESQLEAEARALVSPSGGAGGSDDVARLEADVARLEAELAAARTNFRELRHTFAAFKANERSSRGTAFSRDGLWDLSPQAPADSHQAAEAERILERRFSGASSRRRRMRILSLDGGGARGLFSALILARLATEEPRLFDNIDVIAGTSSGAVIGSLLACDIDPAEIAHVFEELAPEVFHPKPWWKRAVSPMLHSAYDSEVRSAIFRDWTKEKTFAEVKPWLLVTTFKVDGANPHPAASIFPEGCMRWRPALLTNIPRMQGLVEPDCKPTIETFSIRSRACRLSPLTKKHRHVQTRSSCTMR